MSERGIIYSASGSSYVEEAIHSATSSLRYNAVPHLIYCDEAPRHSVNGVTFVVRERGADPYFAKINDIARLPFERTIFIDTDTFVIGNIENLFDLLDRVDLAATRAPGYAESGDPVGPEAFYDFNSGVMVLRRCSAVTRLLSSWADYESQWESAPPFTPAHARDQHALRRALWEERDVSLWTLGPEYNYRSIFPGHLIGAAKIIHGRSTNYEKLAAHLNSRIEPRTFNRYPPEWVW